MPRKYWFKSSLVLFILLTTFLVGSSEANGLIGGVYIQGHYGSVDYRSNNQNLERTDGPTFGVGLGYRYYLFAMEFTIRDWDFDKKTYTESGEEKELNLSAEVRTAGFRWYALRYIDVFGGVYRYLGASDDKGSKDETDFYGGIGIALPFFELEIYGDATYFHVDKNNYILETVGGLRYHF
jgi:hypothetical protein